MVKYYDLIMIARLGPL